MTPYDPAEDRWQSLEHRVTDLEDGPYLCERCDRPYNSSLAALACCDDDSPNR